MPDRSAGLFIAGRPALLNAERGMHWREHRELTRTTRGEATMLWRQFKELGHLERVYVDVYPTYAKGRVPDTGSCMPAVKAIIDGAVDAHLLHDDTPNIVTYLGFHRPVIDKERGDGLMVMLQEIDEDHPWAS